MNHSSFLLSLFLFLGVLGKKSTAEIGDCSPSSPFVILFAYSNDFPQQAVRSTIDTLTDGMTGVKFTKLANIRFDTQQQEDIVFHDDVKSWNASVHSKLPEPALGYGSMSVPSDVLDVLRKFLRTTSPSICGARVLLLLKRFPNDFYSSDVIMSLQENKVFVETVASTSSSGGLYYRTMMDVSTMSNGFFMFSPDDKVDFYLGKCLNAAIVSNLLYSTSPIIVDGKSSTSLPKLAVTSPLEDLDSWTNAYILFNVEDKAFLQNFHNLTFSITNPAINEVIYKLILDRTKLNSGNIYEHKIRIPMIPGVQYNTQLDYDYQMNTKSKLQIRIYARSVEPKWPPFNDE